MRYMLWMPTVLLLSSVPGIVGADDVLYSQLVPHVLTQGEWWTVGTYRDLDEPFESQIICQDFVPTVDGIIETIGVGGGLDLGEHDPPEYVTIEIWRPGGWNGQGPPGERLRRWTIPADDHVPATDPEGYPVLYYDVSPAALPVYAGQIYQIAVYGDSPETPFDWTVDIGSGVGYFWSTADNGVTWDGPFDYGYYGPDANFEFELRGRYDPLLPECDIIEPQIDWDNYEDVVIGPDGMRIRAVELTGNAEICATRFGFWTDTDYIPVGWDFDGTSPLINTHDLPGDGDGWSIEFNPVDFGLTEGYYEFYVEMMDYRDTWAVDFFPFYYDPYPPFPEILDMEYETVVEHGEVVTFRCGGGGPGGSGGERVRLKRLEGEGYAVRWVKKLNQHNYGDLNEDGNGDGEGEAGRWYCAPTATAACILQLAKKYPELLSGFSGTQEEIWRKVVEDLARRMGTRAEEGTLYSRLLSSLATFLRAHRARLQVQHPAASFQTLKGLLEVDDKKGEAGWERPMVVWCIRGQGIGHALAASSISNQQLDNGNYSVDFMDPEVGDYVMTEMKAGENDSGDIEYPPGSGTWRSPMGLVAIVPTQRGGGGMREDGYTLIGEDLDGSDGFEIGFDTSTVEPGIHFVIVEMEDDLGHTGTDYVVIVIPEMTEAPPGLINPGWNWFSIPNFPLDEDDADPNAIFAPDDVTNKILRWNPVVKNLELYPDDFDRLELGRGYVMFASEEMAPSYVGYRQALDFTINLPEEGWTWIGYPQIFDAPLADVLIQHQGLYEERTAAEDAAAPDPWVNWNILYWDSASDTARILGLSGADDDHLRPWFGYRIWSFERDTNLIIPGI